MRTGSFGAISWIIAEAYSVLKSNGSVAKTLTGVVMFVTVKRQHGHSLVH